MERQNKYGRRFKQGFKLSDDFRTLTIDKCLEYGGNSDNQTIPRGTFSKVSEELKVTDFFVRKMWKQFCIDKEVKCKPHKGLQPKLSNPDKEYILAKKMEKPTISLSELREKLLHNSVVPNNSVSRMTICRVIKKDLNMTFKKVSRPKAERFTAANLRYTQAFIDHIQTLDANKILFMDESGYVVTVANRTRGHSEVGTRCVEVERYHPNPNVTLNLIVGLNGRMYHNFVDGTSDTNTYLQFMGEASHANTENGISVIAPGDTIIVDNSPLHRNRAEVTLANFFAPMGVTLIFMPVYSPDLSAAEPVFMKSKIVLKQERFQTIIKENLKFAVSLSLGEVTTSDTREFFNGTGMFNV